MAQRRNKRGRGSVDQMSIGRTLILCGVAIVIGIAIVKSLESNAEVTTSFKEFDTSELLTPRTNPDQTEEIIDYTGYKVSFNRDYHIPNWVSWELLADEIIGEEPRYNKFYQDKKVPGCPTTGDYRGSGYSRGHMAPAADMKWSSEAMKESFCMVNICPQVQSLNGGTWSKLESKCREWARIDSALIIICGPVMTTRPDEFIGEAEVAVPKAFFKVIMAPYANPPRGIGFIMPNGKVIGGLQATAVSIDSVESLTGHDFFATLPDSIQAQIESQSAFHKWSNRK